MADILRSETIKLTIRWLNRIAGLIAGYFAFAALDRIAIATFGICLTLELWATQVEVSGAAKEMRILIDSMDTRITTAVQYEYLSDPKHIWSMAMKFLKDTVSKDEIQSTAFFPNLPDFEKEIFLKVTTEGLLYKRLICYPALEGKDDAHGFPSPDDIKGDNPRAILESYSVWYDKFYTKWEELNKKGDRPKNIESLGMKSWHQALEKLKLEGFEVLSYGSIPSSDYFILRPHAGHSKAVLGFPSLQGGGMRGGFSTTNPSLAGDLSKNWQRLWDQARSVVPHN